LKKDFSQAPVPAGGEAIFFSQSGTGASTVSGMAKRRKLKPPAPWAWALSGAFLLVALGIVLSPLFISRPPTPTQQMRAALLNAKTLSIVRAKDRQTLKTYEKPEDIQRIVQGLAVQPTNLGGRGWRLPEEPKYLLVFDQIEIGFVADEILRAPFFPSDYALTRESMEFLCDLIRQNEFHSK
jgi:hypothetical protein